MNADTRRTIDTLLDELKTRLAIPGQSLLPLLAVMSRFSRYSLANQMLIFAQRPAATHVLGYRSWLKAGYQVRKGEKGIAIYAPMRFTREDPDTLEVNTRTGFKVAWVFDLTQVDALPGTDTSLLAIARGQPTSPPRTAPTSSSRHSCSATTSSSSTRLSSPACSATPTAGASPAACTSQHTSSSRPSPTRRPTCCCTSPSDGSTRPDLVTRETEAEAVTYLLCAQLGLDGTDASIEYIRSYRGTPDTLDACLERIRTTAQRLAAELASIRFDMQHDPGPA